MQKILFFIPPFIKHFKKFSETKVTKKEKASVETYLLIGWCHQTDQQGHQMTCC